MSWQHHAHRIAAAWARPRSGGLPPSASLTYLAETGFWQAQNLEGFSGDLAAWTAAVAAAYQALGQSSPSPPPSPPPSKVVQNPSPPATPKPVSMTPPPAPAPAPASPAPATVLDDLLGWLNT